ncbi:MAG: hypothetical protein ABSF90_16455 [Syntrophobacteraceae bacterium]|jgi:hypothetical protein
MSRKQDITKKGKEHFALTPRESHELQMILDRLAVQDPEGESFEGYLHSLGNSLSERPLLAAVLIDRLSRNPSRTGFRTFQALHKTIEASAYKRNLKQAAYRFSQKGFKAAEQILAPEKVVLIQGEHRKATAHLFMVKGTMWIVSAFIPETLQGGYALVTAFLEDDFATFNVRVAESRTQKLYRDYLQELSAHAIDSRYHEIPPWHAARLFFEMLDFWTAQESYAQLERARDLLKSYHEPDRKPYVYDLMPEIEHPERHFSELEIEKLLEGMDLSWLRFGKEELSPYHEKIKALDSPLLVVPREVQIERGVDLLHDAAESLCTGAKRFLYERFFEEQAMAFKLSGAEDKAHWAWIIARNLADQSSVGKNPAVLQLLRYSLSFHWNEDFTSARKTEETPERERRTESGIILP